MAREGRKIADEKLKELQSDLEDFQSEPGKLFFEDFCNAMGHCTLKTPPELVETKEIHIFSPKNAVVPLDNPNQKQEVPMLSLSP